MQINKRVFEAQKELDEKARKREQVKELLFNSEVVSTVDSTDEKPVQENSQDSQALQVEDTSDLLTLFVKHKCEKADENNGRSLHQGMEPTNTNLERLQNNNDKVFQTQKELNEKVRKTEQVKELLFNSEIISAVDNSTNEKSVQENSLDSQVLQVVDNRNLLTQFVKQECEKANGNNVRSLHQDVDSTNTNLETLQNGNLKNIVEVARKQTETLSRNQNSSSCRDHNTPEDITKSIQASHLCDNEPINVTSITNNTFKEQKLTREEQSTSGNLKKSSEKIKIKEGLDNSPDATEAPAKVTNFVCFFLRCNFQLIYLFIYL